VAFAYPLPWWLLAIVITAAAAVAWFAYRHVASSRAGTVLIVTRFVTLALLIVALMRPVARISEVDTRGAVVAVLVDGSRSMGIADADGKRRIDEARRLVSERLMPMLGTRFQVEVLSFGEGIQSVEPARLTASARESDLSGALAAVAERYRGRPVAGVVLISDGGDTASSSSGEDSPELRVFPIGIGATSIGRDREVVSVTAAEGVLDDSRTELAVSAVSHGHGKEPFDLRLLENGRPIEVRRVTPAGDGSPVHERFQITPARGTASVYTVEVPVDSEELVPENNSRSALVQTPSRRRRILLVEGAPGYEHSFLKRAWSADPQLEIDSIVRKGRDEQGRDTFYIQAAQSRSASLRNGYPTRVQDLFAYDALVLANLSAHQLTRAQLEATRAFVSTRGGGLLVLGALSFQAQGLADTAVEEVLPLDLNARAGGVLPASRSVPANHVGLTDLGAAHPMMQLGVSSADAAKRWEAVPALASVSSLGGPRPGASVLAVAAGVGGTPRPLIAVQRFGEGRSMVFTGEAAWRWRMMMPAADRSYDTFWRQAVRWLSVTSGEPLAVTAPAGVTPGELVTVRVTARDAAFEPWRDAEVDVRVVKPDGRLEEVRASADAQAGPGRYLARVATTDPGVYRVTVEARRRDLPATTATTSFLVGGADAEMSDPRLNEPVLQRLAATSGGQVVRGDDLDALPEHLSAAVPAAQLSVRRDLWHNAWWFLAIIGLLAAEWILRRRWGFR
jgi:uncharacterized membrane protein